jgi:hypothetical protein
MTQRTHRSKILTKSTSLFVGPSAPSTWSDPNCSVFPPASAGDIDFAVANGFSRIVFADALFFDASPPHRELMRALSSGVELFGVASAGALRAVELGHLGMIGRGVIYALFKQGILDDDGELASPLRELDYTSTSPPLVQVRYYLGYVLGTGVPMTKLQQIFSAISAEYFMIRDLPFMRDVFDHYLGKRCDSLIDISDPLFAIKSIDLEFELNRLSCFTLTDQPHRQINMEWLRVGTGLTAEVQRF